MNKGLIHAIAMCSDCDFSDYNYLTAQKKGRNHHIITGHRVSVETGYAQVYERKRLTAQKEAQNEQG
jgi:hypothetical protein